MWFLSRSPNHRYSVRELRSILTDHPHALKEADLRGNTVLHRAARYSGSDAIAFILRADPTLAHRLNDDRQAPLHVAAQYSNVDAIVALLPVCPALLPARDGTGRTPLHLAADNLHRTRDAAFGVLYGAQPSVAVVALADGDTVLHAAVESGHLDAVKCLADKSHALPSARNRAGLLALDVAARRYASIETWTLDGLQRTRSLHAILAVLLRATPQLEFGSIAALDAKYCGSGTLLHRACMLGHTDVVQSVLEVDKHTACVADTQGRLPIHVAADHSRLEAVRALLNVSSDFASARDDQLNTPLHYAAGDDLAQDDFTVDLLLEAAPHVAHSLNVLSETPLMRAACFGNARGLERLLKSVPQTAEVTNSDDRLPICMAIQELQDDVLDACLSVLLHHAPHTAKMQDEYGYTALHYAAEGHRLKAVQAILAVCPEATHLRTRREETAVHLTLYLEEHEHAFYTDDTAAAPIVRALLAANPSLARTSIQFWGARKSTPLHMAAALYMPLCMRELVAVDPYAAFLPNDHNQTALTMALLFGRKSPCSRVILRQRYEDAGAVRDKLQTLRAHGAQDSEFLVAIAANLPLPEGCWELVPAQLEGALGMLGSVLRRGSSYDVRKLVASIDAADTRRLLAAMDALRKAAPGMGDDALRCILAFSFDKPVLDD